MRHYRCHGLRRIGSFGNYNEDINSQYTFDTTLTGSLQRLDGYSPVIFFDCGDYVSKLCSNQELLAQFNEQLNRTVPFKRNTDYFYSMSRGKVKIETFSGITISIPVLMTSLPQKKKQHGMQLLIKSIKREIF